MKQISVRFPEEFLEEIDTIARIEYMDKGEELAKKLA
jgi:metal-responsive CopG/Arc/MetJ family transcriptional regulator